MKATKNLDLNAGVAARVAVEDLCKGDYVAVLNELAEYPSYLWCCTRETLSTHEPVRVAYKPDNAGLPLKVFEICVPFVYVRRPNGSVSAIDVRQAEIVRLNKKTGKRVWKLAKKKPDKLKN